MPVKSKLNIIEAIQIWLYTTQMSELCLPKSEMSDKLKHVMGRLANFALNILK